MKKKHRRCTSKYVLNKLRIVATNALIYWFIQFMLDTGLTNRPSTQIVKVR